MESVPHRASPSTLLPPALLAGLLGLLSPAAAGAQSVSGIPDPGGAAAGRWPEAAPGGGSSYRVQAASDGHFVLRAEDLLPPVGGLWRGMAYPEVSNQALVLYAQLADPTGGLLRVTVPMHRHPSPEALALRLTAGHNCGMRVLFTVVGTPAENSPVPWSEDPILGRPEYAKAPPVDPNLWATEFRDLLLAVQRDTGQLPEYVELWNEPPLELWWTGTGTELLELYRAFASTLAATFPDAVGIGGCGMGRPRFMPPVSSGNTFLEDLIAFAAGQGLPLDFLSWHNYELASSARFYNPAEILRTAGQRHGLPELELLISEWNVYGRALDNPRAIEFGGSHAAAVVAGVLTAASQVALDGQSFYLLQDDLEDFWSIEDLLGDPGALTRRGVKKPVWRLHEFLLGMAAEERIAIDWPRNE